MKQTLSLSVLKVEGIGQEIECFAYCNNSLLDTMLILDTQINENCLEVPYNGILKFEVRTLSKTSQIHCNVSLSAEVLPSVGTVWLPLYPSDVCKMLQNLPTSLPSTKMLVSINQLSLLTPVPEITEYESSMFDIENSLCKGYKLIEDHEQCKKSLKVLSDHNKELRQNIIKLETRLQEIEQGHLNEKTKIVQSNHECFSKLAIQLEKYKLHCSNLQIVHEDHLRQLNSLQILFKQEALQREHIEKQLTRITKEFQEYARVSEEKYAGYEVEIRVKESQISALKSFKNISAAVCEFSGEKDQQITNLQTQLHNCIEQLQESEFSRKVLQKSIENQAEFLNKELEGLLSTPPSQDRVIEDLCASLKKSKIRCSELENLLDDKCINSKSERNESDALSEIKVKNNELTEELGILKDLLAQERRNNESMLKKIREKRSKEIDLKVKGADEKFLEHLRNYGIEDRLEKLAEGIFSFDGERICVAIKNGCLICKVAGAYMGIERFLKSVSKDCENQSIHKRSHTAVLKEKPLRSDSTKSCDKNVRLIKVPPYKENFEDPTRTAQTTKNGSSIAKDKLLRCARDYPQKKAFK